MKFLFKFLFIIFIFSFNLLHAQNTCNYGDSVTTIHIYNTLQVPSQSGPIHSWIGVDTIHDPGFPSEYRVSAIDLNNQGLTGVVPDSIFDFGDLGYLKILDLSYNNITGIEGNLKYTFGGITPTLSEIYLDNNLFSSANTDFFNDFLLNINSVHTFSAATAFDNPVAFKNFVWTSTNVLEYLNLNGNYFSDTLFYDTISLHSPSLIDLHFSDNNFIAIASSQMGGVINLTLHNNNIQDFKDIEILLASTSNSLLFFGGNSVMDTLVQDTLIFSPLCTLLTHLDLSNNKLTGTLDVRLFENINVIENLFLDNNLLSGELPLPLSGTYYNRLLNLKSLDLSNNNLSGDLFLERLLGAQVSSGVFPLDSMDFSSNNFQSVQPSLDDPFYINNISATPYFDNLKKIDVNDNALDFIDLFRVVRIFKFQQISSGGNDHYIPQSGVDTSSFLYSIQDTIGIGGMKRRINGDSVYLDSYIPFEEIVNGLPNYLTTKFTWERVDTLNLAGGSPSSPVVQVIGSVLQNGTLQSPNIQTIAGLSGSEPSFQLSDGSSLETVNKFQIVGLDSLKHANWLYRTKLTNDSFPSLTLYSHTKQVQVGPCLDASGKPVICQSMIVQFDPNLLAGMTQVEIDSMKEELRTSIGATPIEVCLCGDMELWEISDTATTFLEGFGSGTRQTTTRTSSKPQLLSADPDYGLLNGSTNTIPVNSGLPAGSGDNTSKTLVAILDSGVDYAFTPLQSHITEGLPEDTSCINDAMYGYNFLDDNNNASDDHGHGTAVAGIVAGISKNNIVPFGTVSERIGILPLKYTDKYGKGTLFHASCAIRYAADYRKVLSSGDTARVRVINTSWGFLGDPSDFLENALKYLGQNCNVLVVASAGNSGNIVQGADSLRHWPSNSVFDPADTIDIDNVLGVASIDSHNGDQLSSYSNYGNMHIDLAALGTDSTAKAGTTNSFDVYTGTSFAAPQVARVAGLLFDKYPDATYYAMKYALMNSVDTLQSADSLKLKSGGRLNYARAELILNAITNRALCSENFIIDGIEKIESNNDLVKLYPNPVSGALNIEFDATLLDKSIKLSLFNVQGQCLFTQDKTEGTNYYNIPTDELPEGIYFIQFSVGKDSFSKKFLKI
jgi:subtilisin family serine protease